MCRSPGVVNLWHQDRQSSTEKNKGGGRNMCEWDLKVIRRGRVRGRSERRRKVRKECDMGGGEGG